MAVEFFYNDHICSKSFFFFVITNISATMCQNEYKMCIQRKLYSSWAYRKVPKFSDARKLCCNLPKIQTMKPNLSVFRLKDASGIANSEDPDQTAPRGAV